MKLSISLIISASARPTALDKVLRGVSLQTQPPDEIIVADDASPPPSYEVAMNWQPKLPHLRYFQALDAGAGKTAVLNTSIAAAKGEYLVLLDGDCVPHARLIGDHSDLAEEGFWVQGRRCFVRQRHFMDFSIEKTPALQWMFDGRITGWHKGLRLPFPIVKRNMGKSDITGCNMGAWRKDILAVNGYDEDYINWGGEDADIGVRLYHLGRKRKMVCGRAIVYHLNHPPADRKFRELRKQRLSETIRSGKIRCQRGIDQYLAETATAKSS